MPATAPTDPNYLFGSSYNGQVQPHRQTSAPATRVGNVHGSSPVSSNGLHSGLHASSASSPTLHREWKSHARPPVPLFPNNSTGTINQLHHTTAFPESDSQGSSLPTSKPGSVLTRTDMVMQDLTRAAAQVSRVGSSFDELMTSDFHTVNERFDSSLAYNSSYTVSPHEVLLDSNPPSSVFSNLTTPENTFLESPQAYIKSSPYDREILDNTEHWTTLFPDAEEQEPKIAIPVTASSLQNNPTSNNVAPAMSRTTSSGQLSSRGSHQGRMSVSSGVSKARRTQPLPPITVDENDAQAMKRARNTLAARKSRQRRMEHTDDLEALAHTLRQGLTESKALNESLTLQMEMWKQRALNLGYREE